MQTVLIVIHLMVVITLVVVVLLQRSEGGALGMGGGSGFMTGRGQANVLTRATAILASLFFLTSIGLTLLANYSHGNKSILEGVTPSGPSQPASKLPPKGEGSVLDQLRKIEEQRAKPGGGEASDTTPSGGQTPPAPATPPSSTSPGSTAPASKPPTGETPTPTQTEPAGTPNKPAADQPLPPKATMPPASTSPAPASK